MQVRLFIHMNKKEKDFLLPQTIVDLDAPADTVVYTLQASYPGDSFTVCYVVERDRSK